MDESPLTQEDFKAVQALLGEIAQDEHVLQFAKAVVVWMTAFAMFKKMERRLGLPRSSDSRLAYGGIIGQLKGTGKWILLAAGRSPKVLEYLGIEYADLVARVKELTWDDDWAENPVSAAERLQLDAAFSG